VAEAGARLGFNAMTHSWAFALVWLALLVSLGCVVARRLARLNIGKDWGFVLNHTGLWLVMLAGGLGHADREQYMVRVDEGAATSEGHDEAGFPARLPIKVRLHDFTMELYPAAPGARPEPRRFASDVEVTLADGRKVRGVTEVNHPLAAGGWRVYQSGYDTKAGPASTYSVLELVRDPWQGPVYAGFAMIAAGALAMIWKGRRRRGLE
jgi:cytochrome c biogenesis protein ResB